MTVRPFDARQRPLWIGGAGLVLLPIVLQAIGLTYDNATVVVILAMAAMSLNLLVGYTGLVSFGHSAWFGIGGYAAAMFGALARAGVNIELISTSEVRITCTVAEEQLETAVRALHASFELATPDPVDGAAASR